MLERWFPKINNPGVHRLRRAGGSLLVVAAVWLGFSAVTGASPDPEMRGMWVTRFEWPNREGDADRMRSRITEIMETLAENHFNAVYFQVRGQADVFYPSEYEPWSPLIGGEDPGFDPMGFAIAEARRNDLEFHAYINPFPAWGSETPPEAEDHPYLRNPEWLCVDENGEPVYAEYYYFSPGNPEVQAYVRKIIRDVLERYEVDGIHLDRIRYPHQRSSHDAVSRMRFAGEGNPRNLEWADWQRDQITRFVYDLYGEMQAIAPDVKLTAAVWGIYDRTRLDGYSGFSSGYHQYYQDSFAWLRIRAMDALVPMIYWPIGGNRPHYDELYADFLENANGRHIYGGTSSRHSGQDIRRVLQFTRRDGGHGTVAFSHSGIESNNHWRLYRNFHEEQVSTPPMPWKQNPSHGHITGSVVDADGEPVTDASVRVQGLRSTWLSSGDGFFSALHLVPGTHAIAVTKEGIGREIIRDIEVRAGDVSRIDVRLPGRSSQGAAP